MRLGANEASIQGPVLVTQWGDSLGTGTSRCLGIRGQSEGGLGARSLCPSRTVPHLSRLTVQRMGVQKPKH